MPFHLFLNVDSGVALGMLTQEHRGCRQPMAFLSKVLDPVTCGWSQRIQSIEATAILVEESRKLTFGEKLTNQKAERWLTDSRILKGEAILLEKDDLTLTTDDLLNPAGFLTGNPKLRRTHMFTFN
ncbi:Pol polyprotein [Plecturocebus cupreus]